MAKRYEVIQDHRRYCQLTSAIKSWYVYKRNNFPSFNYICVCIGTMLFPSICITGRESERTLYSCYRG